MNTRTPSLLVLTALAACSPADRDLAARLDATNWVDLTHPFNAATIYWPTAQGSRWAPRMFDDHDPAFAGVCMCLDGVFAIDPQAHRLEHGIRSIADAQQIHFPGPIAIQAPAGERDGKGERIEECGISERKPELDRFRSPLTVGVRTTIAPPPSSASYRMLKRPRAS